MIATLLALALAGPSLQDPLPEVQVLDGKGPEMLQRFLEAKVKALAERPVPATRAEFAARQALDRREHLRSLGLDPLPPRTPLNARITGTLERDGYRIEKLVFESRPGLYVVAHLYLPDPLPAEKLPVIVDPHGHWGWKKAEPVVQIRAIAQALHGYLAAVIESPGHSFEGDRPIERGPLGTHDDPKLVLGSSNATAIYVWDMMRLIDYLETRPEADTTRIGITGESGGGHATTYAFAADERIDCAVPVVYATSLAVNPHNGCLCNHVPGTLRIGDRADVLGIRAPAPVLVIGATDDQEFPPEGTRRTGAKMKELWALYGAANKVSSKVFDGPHDYNKLMREAAVGFFDLHLRGVGDGSPVPEPAIVPEPAGSPELACFVEAPKRWTTMRDVAREMLSHAGGKTWDEVVALNGGVPGAVEPVRINHGTRDVIVDGQEYLYSAESIQTEANLRVPLLQVPFPSSLVAELNSEPTVILAEDDGMNASRCASDAAALSRGGIHVIAIDARGCGELRDLDARLMTYLGTSSAFGMAIDIVGVLRALKLHEAERPVVVIGRGPATSQAALFAGLLDREIDLVVGLDGLASYADAFADDVPVTAIQPRANEGATLAELRAMAGERLVWRNRGEPEIDLVALLRSRFP